MFDMSDLFAEVYQKTDSGMYLVKVHYPAIGRYETGWTARASDRYPEKGLWVQPPAIRTGRGYRKVIEFRNDSQQLELIRDAVLRAVDLWNREQDTVIEDIPDEPISLDDIPDF